MDNDKLEEIKKGLENFSVEKFKEEDEKDKIDLSSLWSNIDLALDLSSAGSNITTAASSNFHVGGGGAGGYTFSSNNPYVFTTGGGGAGNIFNSTSSGLHVKGDAEFEGDIKVKGTSLTDRLAAIENRLSILVPDPAKLEHYEALKKAYEHYKTLEALCSIPNKEEK